MENGISPEQEWQWCLVGNIVEAHEYGEAHEIRYGSRQFRPDAKVYINPVYGGMGHEHLLVIGCRGILRSISRSRPQGGMCAISGCRRCISPQF